jgi:hypothetical protein
MNYSDEILNAHAEWRKAEDKVPDYEYEKGYQSRNKTARRLWRKFDELCRAANLKPVEVSHDIIKPTLSFRA